MKMFADTNILILICFIRFHAVYDRRDLMEYLSTAEVAKKWGITPRRVQILCKEGRVDGAMYKGIWLIPDNAKKPVDPRKVRNKGQQN